MANKKNPRTFIGLWGLTSLIINNIIGSGIFSSPSAIIQSTNSIGLSLVLWFITGLIAMTGAFAYVELGSTINIAGGDNNYVNFIKWKSLAFMFTLTIVLVVYPTVLCIQALTFSEYFLQACRFSSTNESILYWLNIAIALFMMFIILLSNIWISAANIVKFIVVMTIIKVFLLLAVVILACIKGKPSNLSQPFENSTLDPDRVIDSFYNAWFAFDGYDIAAVIVEEVREPQILLPKAVSISMFVVTVMYILINFAYAMVLGTQGMIEANNIINTFSEVALGSQSFLIPIVACICLLGAIFGTVFEMGRIIHALSRDGILPSFLSCWHSDKGIPRPAIVFHILISIIFLFLANFTQLNELNGVAYISQWVQKAVSAFLLLFIRLNRFPIKDGVFRFHKNLTKKLKIFANTLIFRLNILFPCLYVVCLISMVLSTVVGDWTTLKFTLISTIAGILIYYIFSWQKGLRRWPLMIGMLKDIDIATIRISERLFGCKLERTRGDKRQESLLVRPAIKK